MSASHGSPLGTPEHWRERAAEAREKAMHVDDPDLKRLLLRIAEKFEHVAMQFEGSAADAPADAASGPRKG